MIKSFLSQEMVIQGEPALDDYLRSDQVDFDDISKEAFQDMVKDFVDMNLILRRLSVPLSLQASQTLTAAADGTITDEDFAQRGRLELKVTALTGTAIFQLEGTNDGGTVYYAVEVTDKDGVTSENIAITETGTYNYFMNGYYKKYRFNLESIGTTVTYSAALYENIFTILHRDKTRAKIYKSLKATQGDVWDGKYKEYLENYEGMLKSSKWYYDSDEDEEISESESDKESLQHNVVFRP